MLYIVVRVDPARGRLLTEGIGHWELFRLTPDTLLFLVLFSQLVMDEAHQQPSGDQSANSKHDFEGHLPLLVYRKDNHTIVVLTGQRGASKVLLRCLSIYGSRLFDWSCLPNHLSWSGLCDRCCGLDWS